jgi:hypothetical protein
MTKLLLLSLIAIFFIPTVSNASPQTSAHITGSSIVIYATNSTEQSFDCVYNLVIEYNEYNSVGLTKSYNGKFHVRPNIKNQQVFFTNTGYDHNYLRLISSDDIKCV